ncbi:MAG TPA: hypothetical protein VHA52_03950, partial [Candidatus Babeliaceae bacterium]|nr:hypothetical protein [Candidatus Babeliaceae bacterium]
LGDIYDRLASQDHFSGCCPFFIFCAWPDCTGDRSEILQQATESTSRCCANNFKLYILLLFAFRDVSCPRDTGIGTAPH